MELHIEQGTVLEIEDAPLGIVTGICGIQRNTLVFTGETGHAGTVPMNARQDALVAASDFISEIFDTAGGTSDFRATVGDLSLRPNVVNAIPRQVELTLEIRSIHDQARRDFAGTARSIAQKAATARNVDFVMTQTYEQPAVLCDADLVAALEKSVRQLEFPTPHLPSGPTHGASAMADLCPISMLFVRCLNGVSHRPEEFSASTDMDAAIPAIVHFLATRP
ncbi:M20/M25/M40 family metallo-hydrolase [Phaeobacter sp. S60]|uniref:M20/M25/M40 family metallo-hydrolase n=1 Tax=Phaeobacter sp. S60 TaxID=1569353 RepID=UPI0006939593|nr:M20/M25/M40 family metallo-hydrolase [Phaeobacter sp. S60]